MNTMIEMYDRIMSVVEEVTGISKDKILTSNCEECVDARHILVYILGNRSFSDNKIAELTGLTRPGVCIIRNNFKYRRKRYFVNLNYERVNHQNNQTPNNLDIIRIITNAQSGAGAGAGANASALAQAEALALLLNGGSGRNGQVNPQPVALYQPAMPCCCNTGCGCNQ